MFGTLQLVNSIRTDVDGFLSVIAVVVAEEPPADESEHEAYGGYEDADGGAGACDVDFG